MWEFTSVLFFTSSAAHTGPQSLKKGTLTTIDLVITFASCLYEDWASRIFFLGFAWHLLNKYTLERTWLRTIPPPVHRQGDLLSWHPTSTPCRVSFFFSVLHLLTHTMSSWYSQCKAWIVHWWAIQTGAYMTPDGLWAALWKCTQDSNPRGDAKGYSFSAGKLWFLPSFKYVNRLDISYVIWFKLILFLWKLAFCFRSRKLLMLLVLCVLQIGRQFRVTWVDTSLYQVVIG